ncbi:hypothetical protein [Nocardia suismassiliense]|uniref:hypothetical protein n=1 Tax=Nocardia suismassiliense TaxID=2077092 RepID=UPI000D1FA916|nr:hypothetical protein [Nocardia suismassiliense]
MTDNPSSAQSDSSSAIFATEAVPAGIERLNDRLYRGGGFLIESSPDGLRLSSTANATIRNDDRRVLAVATQLGADHVTVLTRTAGPRFDTVDLQARLKAGGGAMSGGLDTELQRAILHRLAQTQVPLDQQLTDAGFEPLDGGLFRLCHTDIELSATVTPGNQIVFHRPVTGTREAELIARSQILGVSTHNVSESALRLSNGWLEYAVSSHSAIQVVDARVTRPVTAADVGVAPTPSSIEATGFIVAGDNATATIEALTSINGHSISDLERWMRPFDSDLPGSQGRVWYGGSAAGFLGPHDRLLATMARDNDVVRSLGLSHRELGITVRINNALANFFAVRAHTGEDNNSYVIRTDASLGPQASPFQDGTAGTSDHTITNTATGESVRVADLSGHLIERYGFYQGTGTRYRSAPEQIIATFGHLLERAGGAELLRRTVAEVDAHHHWRNPEMDQRSVDTHALPPNLAAAARGHRGHSGHRVTEIVPVAGSAADTATGTEAGL